jgi:hypothetical protein
MLHFETKFGIEVGLSGVTRANNRKAVSGRILLAVATVY